MRSHYKKYTYLLAFLASSMLSISGQAGVDPTFIPDEPVIESPTNMAEDISKTPTIEAALPTAKLNSDQTDFPVNLIKSEWIVFKADTNVQLVGGSELSNTVGESDFPVITVPFPLENVDFDGHDVASMEIGQLGFVNFKDSEGVLLARIDARITYDYRIQPSLEDAYIAIKTFGNAVSIQWYQKSSATAPTEWVNTAEAMITDDSQLIVRNSIDDLSNAIYDLTAGVVGCSMLLDDAYPSAMTSITKNLPGWKSFLQENARDNFSLLCSATFFGDDISLQTLQVTTPSVITLPTITKFESTNTEYTLTGEQSLEPNTEYMTQVRYTVKDQADTDEVPFTQTSQWSQAVSFTTVPPQVDYVVTAPAITTFTVDTPTQVQISVKNNGTETGKPVIELLLPLNFLSELNGSVSDFYTASVDQPGSCPVSLVSGQTLISCAVEALAPGESTTYTATVTMTELSQNKIEYRICDDSVCDTAEFIAVDVSVINPRTDNEETATPSASTGGSGGVFLYLLALTGLLGRRFK